MSRNLVLRSCSFINNSVTVLAHPALSTQGAFGGAIATGEGTTFLIEDCQFVSNSAIVERLTDRVGMYADGVDAQGGAVYLQILHPATEIQIRGSVFVANRASGQSTPSQVVTNSGDGNGGAIAIEKKDGIQVLTPVHISRCYFAQNEAVGGDGGQVAGDAAGGAVISFASTRIEGCQFINNSARSGKSQTAIPTVLGGAVYIQRIAAWILDSRFTGNSVFAQAMSHGSAGSWVMGGALTAETNSTEIRGCAFANNSAWAEKFHLRCRGSCGSGRLADFEFHPGSQLFVPGQ